MTRRKLDNLLLIPNNGTTNATIEETIAGTTDEMIAGMTAETITETIGDLETIGAQIIGRIVGPFAHDPHLEDRRKSSNQDPHSLQRWKPPIPYIIASLETSR
jgi:hypothetical protein